MKVGKPDPETAGTPEPTLAQAVRARLARTGAQPGGASERKLAIAVGGLIALAPILTIGGGTLLANRERAATARMQAVLEPRMSAARGTAAARLELDAALRKPSLAAMLERLARALPADATLVRAERTAEGVFEFDVASSDPDRLRAALRRTGEFARARNVGQRQSDTGMIVSFRGAAK